MSPGELHLPLFIVLWEIVHRNTRCVAGIHAARIIQSTAQQCLPPLGCFSIPSITTENGERDGCLCYEETEINHTFRSGRAISIEQKVMQLVIFHLKKPRF